MLPLIQSHREILMPNSPVQIVDRLAVKARNLFLSMDVINRWTVTTMAPHRAVLR